MMRTRINLHTQNEPNQNTNCLLYIKGGASLLKPSSNTQSLHCHTRNQYKYFGPKNITLFIFCVVRVSVRMVGICERVCRVCIVSKKVYPLGTPLQHPHRINIYLQHPFHPLSLFFSCFFLRPRRPQKYTTNL